MKYTNDILTESDDTALQIMQDHWDLSGSHYEQQFEDMKRWKRLYHLKVRDPGVTKKDIGKNIDPTALPAIFYPVARAVCDTTKAGIRGTLMPDEFEWLEAIPRNSEMKPEELAILRTFMNFRMNQMKFAKNVERMLLQAMQARWSVGLTDWRIKPGYIRLRQPEKMEALRLIKAQGRKGLLKRFLSYLQKDSLEAGFEYDPYKESRSHFQVLPTLDTRPDWRSPEIEDSEFFAFERFVPWTVLEEGSLSKYNPDGHYYNITELKKRQEKQRADSVPSESRVQADEISKAPTAAETPPDGIVLRYYITDTGMVICDQEYSMIVAKRRLEGKPLVKLTYGDATDSFDGEAAMQMMEPLQTQINYVVNAHQSNVDRRLRQIIGINRGEMVDDTKEITLGPGDEIIEFWSDTRQCMSSIEFPDVTPKWQEDVQFLLEAIVRLTGMDVNSQGLYFVKHKPTATETDKVRDAMMTRLGQWQRSVETDVIAPAAGQLYSLEDAFYDEELMLAIFGVDATYYPIMTRRVFDMAGGAVGWVPRGSLYWQTKREELATVERIFDRAMSAMPLQQNINFLEIFMDMLRTSGVRDPERYLINRTDRQYTIRPEQEHKLLANGTDLDPGDLDDHQDHQKQHQAYLQRIQSGMISPQEFPPYNIGFLTAHQKKHEERLAAMQTTNPMGMGGGAQSPESLPSGQTQLPQMTSGTQTANMENIQIGA